MDTNDPTATNDNPTQLFHVGDFNGRNSTLRVYCAADGSIEVTTPASRGRRPIDLHDERQLLDDDLDELIRFLAEKCHGPAKLCVLTAVSGEFGKLLSR